MRALKDIESDGWDEVRSESRPKAVVEAATMTTASLTSSLTSLPSMVDAAAGIHSAATSPSRPSSARGSPSKAAGRSCAVQSSLSATLAAALCEGSGPAPPSPCMPIDDSTARGHAFRSVDYDGCNSATQAATSPPKSPAKSPAKFPAASPAKTKAPGPMHVTPPSTPLLQSNSSPSCAGARFSPAALQKTPPSLAARAAPPGNYPQP